MSICIAPWRARVQILECYVKHCKLERSEPLKRMEFFVAGTPARAAADLVGGHGDSAIFALTTANLRS